MWCASCRKELGVHCKPGTGEAPTHREQMGRLGRKGFPLAQWLTDAAAAVSAFENGSTHR